MWNNLEQTKYKFSAIDGGWLNCKLSLISFLKFPQYYYSVLIHKELSPFLSQHLEWCSFQRLNISMRISLALGMNVYGEKDPPNKVVYSKGSPTYGPPLCCGVRKRDTAVSRGTKMGHCRAAGYKNATLPRRAKMGRHCATGHKTGCRRASGCKNGTPAAPQDAKMGHRCTFGHENGPPPCLRVQKWAAAAPRGMKTGMGHGALCHARMGQG